MYGYEMDYGYEPATEGIKSFFESVLDMCRKAGQMIKEFLDKIAYALKKMVNDPDTVKKESSKATAEIKKIGKDIKDLLDRATDDIDRLLGVWILYAKGKNIKDRQKGADAAEKGKHVMITNNTNGKKETYSGIDFSKQNGMDADLDHKAMEKDDALNREWDKAKASLGESFVKSERQATEISARLKGLSQYGRLTYNATKGGYDSLREIFDANGKFGDQWRKVQSAAEWSTGSIKVSLNKIVSMYKVGVSATQAFGRRLERGNVATNKGEAYSMKEKKGIMAEGKAMNRVYADYTTSRDITTGAKSKQRQDWAAAGNPPVDSSYGGRNGLVMDDNVKELGRAAVRAGTAYTSTDFAKFKKEGAYAGWTKDQKKEFDNGSSSKKRQMMVTAGWAPANSSVGYAGYALDKLYAAAYEDAYNDIQEQQYYKDVYDSVPGAFEFVEEDADYDAYEDEMIYDYDPLSEDVDVDVYGF